MSSGWDFAATGGINVETVLTGMPGANPYLTFAFSLSSKKQEKIKEDII